VTLGLAMSMTSSTTGSLCVAIVTPEMETARTTERDVSWLPSLVTRILSKDSVDTSPSSMLAQTPQFGGVLAVISAPKVPISSEPQLLSIMLSNLTSIEVKTRI
jgi:hypothetical protein